MVLMLLLFFKVRGPACTLTVQVAYTLTYTQSTSNCSCNTIHVTDLKKMAPVKVTPSRVFVEPGAPFLKAQKLFGPVKPQENLEPCDYRGTRTEVPFIQEDSGVYTASLRGCGAIRIRNQDGFLLFFSSWQSQIVTQVVIGCLKN